MPPPPAAAAARTRAAPRYGAAPPSPFAPRLKGDEVRVALVQEAVSALCAPGGVEHFELSVLAAELSRLVAQHQARAFSQDELRGCLRQLEEDNRLMFRGERIDVWD